MISRFQIELPEQPFERLGELAMLHRRTVKAEAQVLLEAALEDRPENSGHLELVGAGRPSAA